LSPPLGTRTLLDAITQSTPATSEDGKLEVRFAVRGGEVRVIFLDSVISQIAETILLQSVGSRKYKKLISYISTTLFEEAANRAHQATPGTVVVVDQWFLANQ
jgi:hypothetical protein